VVVFDNDARPTISVAISIDDNRLVPVSITVAVSIDDDRLVTTTPFDPTPTPTSSARTGDTVHTLATAQTTRAVRIMVVAPWFNETPR
jgi:hypothetical protein